MTFTPPELSRRRGASRSPWEGMDLSMKIDPQKAGTMMGRLLAIMGRQDQGDPLETLTPTSELAEAEGVVPGAMQAEVAGGIARPYGGDEVAIEPGGGFGAREGGHEGIDFPVPMGTPIVSFAPGTVVQVAGEAGSGGYGNMVVVDHGNGLTTRYAHLSSINVAVGDKVGAGSGLGAAGSTGKSTGPHLHFETMMNGVQVDPAPYLAGAGGILGAPAATPTAEGEPAEPSLATIEDLVSMMMNPAADPLGAGTTDPFATLSKGQKKKGKGASTLSGETTGADNDPGAVDAFLAALRTKESGGNYQIYNESGLSNASGAYQFIGTTWRGRGGSTANAAEASPAEQDRIAREYALELFEQFGSWRLVAAAWYGGPGIAQQIAAGRDPGAPDQQGRYLDYADSVVSMMGGG